jgi:hypothetical protein
VVYVPLTLPINPTASSDTAARIIDAIVNSPDAALAARKYIADKLGWPVALVGIVQLRDGSGYVVNITWDSTLNTAITTQRSLRQLQAASSTADDTVCGKRPTPAPAAASGGSADAVTVITAVFVPPKQCASAASVDASAYQSAASSGSSSTTTSDESTVAAALASRATTSTSSTTSSSDSTNLASFVNSVSTAASLDSTAIMSVTVDASNVQTSETVVSGAPAPSASPAPAQVATNIGLVAGVVVAGFVVAALIVAFVVKRQTAKDRLRAAARAPGPDKRPNPSAPKQQRSSSAEADENPSEEKQFVRANPIHGLAPHQRNSIVIARTISPAGPNNHSGAENDGFSDARTLVHSKSAKVVFVPNAATRVNPLNRTQV